MRLLGACLLRVLIEIYAGGHNQLLEDPPIFLNTNEPTR